jgi:hypothetical protein
VLQRIWKNTYKIELPGDYGVSATFNISDLSSYEENENATDLMASPHQLGESEMGMSNMNHLVQASAQVSLQAQHNVKGQF